MGDPEFRLGNLIGGIRFEGRMRGRERGQRMALRERQEKIREAYQSVGGRATLYDEMVTYRGWLGRLASRMIWSLDGEKARRYVEGALAGIPEGFAGRLLEVPVGTGCLTLPFYRGFPKAEFFCVDYAEKMLAAARERAAFLGVGNARFLQGDVGALPFGDGTFDAVLTLNGLHVFPDKEGAFRELFRVLKPGGSFCGTCYVSKENGRTDFFVRHVLVRKGFFTPPFHTARSLRECLEGFCEEVCFQTVEAHASFACRKKA